MKRTIVEVKDNINKVHKGTIALMNKTMPKYKEKLTLQCNVCYKVFYTTYDNLVNKGSGCPYCAKHLKTNEDFINELHEIFGKRFIYDKVHYFNAKTAVTVICPKHGEFYKTPNKLLQGQGCPKCKLSKLENIVMRGLLKHGIKFETQKRFDWLGKQSLDFYLSDYDIAIECQGEQHFHQVYFNGKTDNIEERNLFDNIKKRDELKFSLCKENSIKIIYFIDNKIDLNRINSYRIYMMNYYNEINTLIKVIKVYE